MVTNAAAGYGGLGRSSSLGLITRRVLLNGRLAGSTRLVRMQKGVCEIAPIALEVVEKDKEKRGTGDNYKLEEYIAAAQN